jgi:DNA-binding transcriptional LysR family regulator
MILDFEGGAPVTLTQIQYFLTAARCLNFSVAAQELYISRPALGRQITAMEEELGVKLFVRGKTSMSLTPMGSMLRSEFTTLMVNYNEILQKIYAMGQEDSIRIRIGVLEGYGLGDVLPQFLNICQRDYPHLMVELSSHSYLELKRQLLAGELDLLLTFQHDLQEQPDILFRALCTIPTYFVHHRNAVDKLKMQEGDQLLILNSPEDSSASFARDKAAYEQMGLILRYKLASHVSEQLFFVRQGYGCAILAGNCPLRTDPAIEFHRREELEPVNLVAAWNANTANPGIHLVVELLQKLIDQSEERTTW